MTSECHSFTKNLLLIYQVDILLLYYPCYQVGGNDQFGKRGEWNYQIGGVLNQRGAVADSHSAFSNIYVRKPDAAEPAEEAVSHSLFPVGKRINDDYVMQLYGLDT